MAKNEIAKSDKTMFPDMLKKSNFLIRIQSIAFREQSAGTGIDKSAFE